jgi:hypothetical protein
MLFISELYVQSVCLNLIAFGGGGGAKFMKYLKGAQDIKVLEPLD